MLTVAVQSRNSAYGRAYMESLIDEHRQEWENVQRQSRVSAGTLLEDELVRLEEQIRSAEDDVIEYQRLNDIARVEKRGTMESRYLSALMGRRSQLTTELMLIEAQYPAMKDASAAVIRDVGKLTRATGDVKALDEEPDDGDPSK